MAKKYYWLKLKEDFFDDETIKYIEEQENGYRYSNFYLKLCLKSLRYNGKLIRLVGETLIPYDIKSLSRLTGVDVDTVRCAMALLEKVGCVNLLETGEIYLSQVEEMVGKETDKAVMMRRLRAQKKSEVTLLPECYTEIDKEKDKEEEIDNTSVPDYEQIRNLFVEICKDLPQPNSVKTWTPARKKTISSANMDLPEWEKLFKAVAESDFLCGKKRDWKASFDWIIKPANRQKILEGTYRNTQKPKSNGNPSGPTSYNIEEFESALLEDMMGGYDAEK